MSEDSILMCLIAFVLGYLIARMMRGDGLVSGGECPTIKEFYSNKTKKSPLMNATYNKGTLNYCVRKKENNNGWITNEEDPSNCVSPGYKKCSLNLGAKTPAPNSELCRVLEDIYNPLRRRATPALAKYCRTTVMTDKATHDEISSCVKGILKYESQVRGIIKCM